jgi:hypothetical protein
MVFSLLVTFPSEPIAFPFTEGSTETFTEDYLQVKPKRAISEGVTGDIQSNLDWRAS